MEKRVFEGGTANELLALRYVYDGWNLLAEFSADGGVIGTLRRSYTWGLDIVNTLSDAGGVGALVQIDDHLSNKAFLPTYDANGNIITLVNEQTGAIAAIYEYSPYGEPLRAQANDPVVADQPFRFSTKYTDGETGLVYYGHRYYSPKEGKFINRDPIEESGGMNLYGFVGNNPINRWDFLGNEPDGEPEESRFLSYEAYQRYLKQVKMERESFIRYLEIREQIDAALGAIRTDNIRLFAEQQMTEGEGGTGKSVKGKGTKVEIGECTVVGENLVSQSTSDTGSLTFTSDGSSSYDSALTSITGILEGLLEGSNEKYSDPNPIYEIGALMFRTTLSSQQVSSSEIVPYLFSTTIGEIMGKDCAGSFHIGDIKVTIDSIDRPSPNSIPFTVTKATVEVATTVYYNTSHYTFKNGVPRLQTQYAEYQHAKDFWIARDSYIIPLVNILLLDTYYGRPENAAAVIRLEILHQASDAMKLSRLNYDNPRGPHAGGPNKVPSDFSEFP